MAGKTWEAATGLDDALVALATCPTEEWLAIGCIRLIGGAAIDAASGLWDELTACVGSFGTTDMRTGTRRCMKLILGFAAGGVVVKLLKRLATHSKAGDDDDAQDSGRELGEGSTSVEDVWGSLDEGRQPNVKVVGSANELQQIYDELTRGGTSVTWEGYPGTVIRRADGVEVGIRPGSKSGGPTIDIRTPGHANRKIHVR